MAITNDQFNELVELVNDLNDRVTELEAAEDERVALAGGRYVTEEQVSDHG